MADASRDNNQVTTLIAVSNVDGVTPVPLWADPVTHRLLVSAATSSETEVWGEVPTGTVNGLNTDFVFANTPNSGTLRLYVNGQRLKITTDYTLSTATVTCLVAPPTGSIIIGDYNY